MILTSTWVDGCVSGCRWDNVDKGESGDSFRKSLGVGENNTSGNVPFEKTLEISVSILRDGFGHWTLHQQACLSAGTIANDDKFATDLSHGGCFEALAEMERSGGVGRMYRPRYVESRGRIKDGR